MVINTSEDISGFQFTIVGPEITSFDGGFSEQYGFSIANNSETGIIIGYSLSGSVIPAGSNGVLTTLFFENQNLNICLEDVIFSDPNAIALDINFIGDCVEYYKLIIYQNHLKLMIEIQVWLVHLNLFLIDNTPILMH